jgi:hypothetical protein
VQEPSVFPQLQISNHAEDNSEEDASKKGKTVEDWHGYL